MILYELKTNMTTKMKTNKSTKLVTISIFFYISKCILVLVLK